MRRCPVCDFIYEDDERLCAMDGTGLVNHSGPLPFEESAPPRSVALTNSHGSGLTLIAAGIILAIALFLYFHNVVKRNVLQSNPQGAARAYDPSRPGDQNPVVVIPVETATPLITPSPAFNPTPPQADAPPKIYRARQRGGNDHFRAVPVETGTTLPRPMPSSIPMRPKIDVPLDNSLSSPVKSNPPPLESRPSTTPDKEVRPADTNKNESKITTFLKKARRLLKKPFKH
jgi:hypothetical protein